jgi:hypothetical protein
MSLKSDIPFNINVLVLDDKIVSRMRPVTSLDTYAGATKSFHPDGLFSSEIFGVTGTEVRKQRFSYIDLHVPIIHPTLYKALAQVRGFYLDILARREFAVWNPDTSDFDRSDVVEGRTGFEFFCEYLPRIKFPNNDTETRQQAVALLETFRDKMLMSRITVIPAGFREFEIDDNGRESANEINDFYWKLIATSNTINRSTLKNSPEAYDVQRVTMQNTVIELYELFTKMIEGKKNLFMGKFAGRKVNNGTRNVITSMNTVATELGHKRNVTINHTLVGLYQFAKSILPITLERLRNDFIDRAFTTPGAPAKLCDSVTMMTKRCMLKADSYSKWLSAEGLEKQITYYKEESIRHTPIMIEGNYLGLVYRGPDGTFAMISGVDELPAGHLAEHCSPITLTDLLYHALYTEAHRYYGFVTRYPITGIGSTYPSATYLKTTIKSEERRELDPTTWEPMDGNHVAYEFPVLTSSFFNSMSPHGSRLARLGADFDGDTCSWTVVYSVEACGEIRMYHKSKRAYVGTDGRFINDIGVDTIKFVLQNMTGY